MYHVTLTLLALRPRLFRLSRFSRRERDERGDVPGWVMICVMTAGLVVGLTAVAAPALQDMVNSALATVR